MKNETLLHEQIKLEFEELKKMPCGEDQYNKTVDGLTKLVDKAIEIDRLNLEAEEKAKNREIEAELKFKQLEDEKKDRKIKNVITGVSVVGGLITTWFWSGKSFKFEEAGTITTGAGRNFINKALNYFTKK